MEHLSIALRALFSRQKGDDILSSSGFMNNSPSEKGVIHLDSDLTESQVTNLLLLEEPNNYSIDQLSMTGQLILSKWMVPDSSCLPMKFRKNDSVYNALLYFASATLRIVEGDPVCRYDSLLRWHTLTTQLGEDIFSSAYLASRDVLNDYRRKFFDWQAFLPHDCKEINAIFERPIADLHMHLKGSSYNFDISWICLMNHIEEMSKQFEDVAFNRKDTVWDNTLFDKVRRAAAIRLYLAGILKCVNVCFTKSNLCDILSSHSSFRDMSDEEKAKDPELVKTLSNRLLSFGA